MIMQKGNGIGRLEKNPFHQRRGITLKKAIFRIVRNANAFRVYAEKVPILKEALTK